MNDNINYGLGGLLIGGLLVWLVTISIVNSNNTGMMGMMGYRSGSQVRMMQNSSSIDAHFIEQMIPHHEDAITMAKLAQAKAQRPEVKELADNIITSQGEEIKQMKAWYKDWFGKELAANADMVQEHGMGSSSSMHMGMMGSEGDLTELENATDFETAFVEQMVPHHQMAVMMANMLKNGTDRPEMKKLAKDIISAQTREIEQMRGWLTNW